MVGTALNMLMPLEKIMYSARLDESFVKRATWHVKFAWWPRRCWLSGRQLWLTRAYQGTAMWTGPSNTVFEYRWVDRDQYLVAKIKGTL